MPTRGTSQGGLGAAVKEVTSHASAWFALERELAILEIKKKLGAFGLGLGLVITGALFALYGLGFLFATIAAALESFMPRPLALLVVTSSLFVVAGVLAILGLGRIKKGTPPVPEQAIQEAKLTTSALKSNGNQ